MIHSVPDSHRVCDLVLRAHGELVVVRRLELGGQRVANVEHLQWQPRHQPDHIETRLTQCPQEPGVVRKDVLRVPSMLHHQTSAADCELPWQTVRFSGRL